MKKVYPKKFGRFSYEILDEEAYEQYWWGKKPSTKKMFEEWLNNPEKKQRKVAIEYGRLYNSINLHLNEMTKQGIIRRFKRDDYDPAERKLGKRRSEIEILVEILIIVQDGVKKTEIVYRANSNFSIMTGYLSDLIDRGLLEVDGKFYITTEKGNKFLEQYQILMQT